MNNHTKYTPAQFITKLLGMQTGTAHETASGSIRKTNKRTFNVTPSRAALRKLEEEEEGSLGFFF